MAIKRIIVGGDILPWYNNAELFKRGDVKSLFGEKICDLFRSSDFSILNLEGPLSESSLRQNKIGPTIKADKETINGFKALGVKAVALANNHITDYLDKGVRDTIETLEGVGIQYVGVGLSESSIKTHISTLLGDKRICIYNVSESFFNAPGENIAGVNLYDEYLVCNEIRHLKDSHDYLIVIYHGGAEYFPFPTPLVRRRFHRMADSGADFITAQHTHCIGCEEFYGSSYLLYGQGNFLFSREADDPIKKEGILSEIVIDSEGFNVVKHKVELTIDNCLKYSDNQSFEDFYERGRLIYDDEFILGKYKNLKPENLVDKYLLAYKGNSKVWRFLKILLPRKLWRKAIKAYTSDQVQRVLFTMQSDRANEDVSYIWRRFSDSFS